jgi:hypothetical protein
MQALVGTDRDEAVYFQFGISALKLHSNRKTGAEYRRTVSVRGADYRNGPTRVNGSLDIRCSGGFRHGSRRIAASPRHVDA